MTDVAPLEPKQSRRLERILATIIGLIVVLGLGSYALAYGLSPATIRHPAHTHFHYRIILLNNGQAVNFGNEAFQTSYTKDICSAALTKQPIHFHDNNGQYGHIHWAGMTGGLVLKNYGWNLIGGLPDTLGYRFDQGVLPKRVPIHGKALPARVAGANYYVYTGTATDHTARNWNDFLHQPLPTFLGGSQVVDSMEDMTDMQMDDHAASVNDVVGNLIIFVQKTPPTAAQVTAQFNNLKPLPESPCEG